MPSQYSITEPHPTTNKFMYSGRGGAGNTFKAPKTTEGRIARGPPSLFEAGLPAGKATTYSAGRGGAGNIHHSAQRPSFSFDDELERQGTREKMMKDGAVYHVGRGGAGNWTSSIKESERKYSSSSASSDDGSQHSGFFGRLSNTFERR